MLRNKTFGPGFCSLCRAAYFSREIVGTHEGALLREHVAGTCCGNKLPRVYRPLALYRLLAVRWNAPQPGGQNNGFQLPREKKSLGLSSRCFDVTCKESILMMMVIKFIGDDNDVNGVDKSWQS